MISLFKINFFKRFVSAIIFVPLILIPLIIKGYILYFIFITLLTLIFIEIKDLADRSRRKFFFLIYSFICLVTFFLLIILIQTDFYKSKSVIQIVLIIWLFDTFSYLGGSIFKGKKLFPKISKGKTVSGLISGIFMTLLFYNFYLFIFDQESLSYLSFPILIILLSFIGDLLVSLLKRSAEVKDSGNLMPGHGGITDRMDSFIFVFFFLIIFNIL